MFTPSRLRRAHLQVEALESREVPAVVASYEVTQDWGTGFQAQIRLTNQGPAPVVDWTLAFEYSASITSIWDGRVVSRTGNAYVVTHAGWNKEMAVGQTVAFGFVATPGTPVGPPMNFVLNGIPLGNGAPPPAPPPTLATIQVSDVSVLEGNSGTPKATFTFTLSAASSKKVTFNYATADGTASAGSDYVAKSGSITFRPGETSKTLNVKVRPDARVEGDETFFLTLSNARNAVLSRSQAQATLLDDDAIAPPPPADSTWPDHVFAPYVDMTLWPTYDLVGAARDHGIKHFHLAFVVSDPQGRPSWGGYSVYGLGSEFDQQMKSQIAGVRSLGGDVIVSFGGAANQELAQVITNVGDLANAYQAVIDAYGLTRIDFDIEGAAVAERASVDRRSQAIALLQQRAAIAGRELDVWFTLPVLPTGLTPDGLYVVQSALNHGVRLGGVNVMAMDYGDSAAPNPEGRMGDYAIQAANSVFGQMKPLYGASLTDAQLWQMLGVTPMIGLNDVTTEVFDQQEARELADFARQKGLGMLAMWSLNRDQQHPSGKLGYVDLKSSSLLQDPFEFSLVLGGFAK